MKLTSSQSASYNRLRHVSNSQQAVPLTDDAVRALIYLTASDLGFLNQLPPIDAPIPGLYESVFTAEYRFPGTDPKSLYAKAISANPESESYIGCLAAIHKARLKFARVLATQQFPTMDQVGPRSLLQFNLIENRFHAAWLTWRKWLFDIDNRSGQETGYLFEPVIAAAIGGIPVSAAKSPIRRLNRSGGRQIDCLKESRAYEIKIRVTIAASGQGRWSEELTFPQEARHSGYQPILVVLDPTANPKLSELQERFHIFGGEVYVGNDAWNQLEEEAGTEMAIFLEKYIRHPLQSVLESRNGFDTLPSLLLEQQQDSIRIASDGESFVINRSSVQVASEPEVIPEDAGLFLPGLEE